MHRSHCLVELGGDEPETVELFLGETHGFPRLAPRLRSSSWEPLPETARVDVAPWVTEAALCLEVGEAAEFEPANPEDAASTGGLTGCRQMRLLEVDPANDLLGDGRLMLRTLDPGPGGQKPRDLARVWASWHVWFARNAEPVVSWERGTDFLIDEAQVMVCLELALKEMEAGSRACLRVSEDWGTGPLTPDGMSGPCLRGAAVWVEIELKEVANEPAPGEHTSVEDAIKFAVEKKRQGNECLARKTGADDLRALRRYNAGIAALEAVLPGVKKGKAKEAVVPTVLADEAQRPAVEEALITLQLNAAQAELRRNKWREAIAFCDAVLARSPDSAKARYRRGVARAEVGEFKGALEDLRAAASANAGDAGVRRELARVEALYKEHKAEERSAFGGVFDKMAQKEKEREEREAARQKAQEEKEAQLAEERKQAAAKEAEKARAEAEAKKKADAETSAAADAQAKADAEASAEANAQAPAPAAPATFAPPPRSTAAAAAAEAPPAAAKPPPSPAPPPAPAAAPAPAPRSAQEDVDAKAQEIVEQLKASGKIPSTMRQVQTVEAPPSVDYEVPSFLARGRKKRSSA